MIEAVGISHVFVLLKNVGVGSYAIISHVSGQGNRRGISTDEFAYEVENVYLIAASDVVQAEHWLRLFARY